MEVHAHTHTARKKWTHYLWEFLMLFLAVFCGFLAENWREHYVEGKRVKVLAASLYTDLEKDTAQLNFLEKSRLNRSKNLDTLNILLQMPAKQVEKAIFYRQIKRIYVIYTFSQARGTIDQLKNAGYLRYFSDNQLIQHISDYEFMIQDYKIDENIGMKWYDKFLEATVNDLDHNVIDTLMQTRYNPEGIGITQLTSEVAKDLGAIIVIQRANNRIIKAQIDKLNNKAIEIMSYLKKTYHLK